jgi:hypothetical protein
MGNLKLPNENGTQNENSSIQPKMDDNGNVVLTKEQFDSFMDKLSSVDGLAELVKTQSETTQKQAETIKTLTDQVETATARADNAAAVITQGYMKPAKIAGGKWPYITRKAKVYYQQASVNGVISSHEVEFEITMPEACGKTNSRDSEMKNRIIPRLMQEKGITDYVIRDVALIKLNEKEDESIELKPVSFIGKKPNMLSKEECEEFAIIYEGFQIPINTTLTSMRTKVAEVWAYVMHDCATNRPLIVDGKFINKDEYTIDLVEYKGIRQDMPKLEAHSPSQFREMADAQLNTQSTN